LDEPAILLVVRNGMWTWADETHVPLDDVEELRQLVERVPPQEPAEARHAIVVAGRLAYEGAVVRRAHRAELVDGDLAAVEPVTALLEDDRARRRAGDAERDEHHERHRERQDARREGQVGHALDEAVDAYERRLAQRERGNAVDAVDARLDQIEREDVRDEVDRRG